MESCVLLDIADGVARLTLNRPAQRNPLTAEMRDAIAAAIATVRDDHEVHALVLTGAGAAFCAGGDLVAMQDPDNAGLVYRERIRKLHRWFPELVNLEKPVIAAVNGAAFGAGLNLALAADFVLASPQASFCAVFGRIGFVPDLGGMYLLPRIVGLQRAKDLVFTARTLQPEEARDMGIVYRIVPAAELLAEATAMAGRFAAASLPALGMAKSIMNQSFHLDAHAMAELEAYAQTLCRATAYHQDAVGRFATKTPLAFDWDRPPD
jgi:2-(1,2-epoxy-1,2-dihydrophenyl)acetyl-CoA isomerase